MSFKFLCVSIQVFLLVHTSHSQLLEGIYCDRNNCYDVLGVTREASKQEIAKAYRKLARTYHPDMHRDPEAKVQAEENFKMIANAYEILKDDESRADYDYMLDNPDAYYANYYRYYRRRVAPKVDVRIVIFVTLTVISTIQFFSAKQRYNEAIKYFMSVPKYRNRALDIAKDEGLINHDKRSKKSKAEQKEEQEKIIQSIIEEKMDIKGAYAKPTLYDVLWIQLIISPYTISKCIYWHMSFFWRHSILKHPYTDDEKLYIVRKFLKIGQHQFDSLEDELKEMYLKRELWIREHFDVWKKEEEENMKVQLAENARYKQIRRYRKKYGIPRMTFDDS